MEFYLELQEQGRSTPLDDKPEIEDPDYYWYVNTYVRLSRSRPIVPMVSGYTAIPYTEYVAYFSIFDSLEDDVSIDIDRLIQLDSRYVEIKNSQAASSNTK